MEIGKINTLIIVRDTDFGFFLEDEERNEVLMPNAYITDDMHINDKIDVFIYKDSEDRIVATTLIPLVQLGEFAYLQVKEVNDYGAFLDWGLPKDLMVPYAEQTKKMEAGEWHLVILQRDERTDRLIGSAKLRKFIHYDNIELNPGDEVSLILYRMTDLGMSTVVNNKYQGLIFTSDIHKDIQPGDKLKGYVRQLREDGKLDIVLDPIGYRQSIDKNSEMILAALKDNNGFLSLTDKSAPEKINIAVGLSKKAFKKGLGNLYKQKMVEISENGIKILPLDS